MRKKYTKQEIAKELGIHLTEEELTSNAYDLEEVGGIAPPQAEEKKVEYGKCPECGANIQIWNCVLCGDGHPY